MPLSDITPVGAFVNSINAAGKANHNRQPSQWVEKPRKPIVRSLALWLLALFMA